MTSGDPIKFTDLAEPDAFPKLLDQGDKLIDMFDKLSISAAKAMSAIKGGVNGGAPKTVSEVETLNANIKKVTEYNTVLEKSQNAKKVLTIETAKARLELQNYNNIVKNSAKDEAGMISAYQKESATLRDLQDSYKSLVITNQQNTEAGKLLLKNVQDLDSKLKAVDATVGQHQRNVGNYAGTIQKLGKGLGGATGLVAAFGAAFGVNTEVLERFHEVSKELIHTVRELHHATELGELSEHESAAAHVENTVAVEAEIVAQEELVAAQTLGVGAILAIVAGLAILGAAIYEYISAKEDEEIAENLSHQAMDGTIIKSKELRKAYNEHLIALTEVADEYKVFNGVITATQASVDILKQKYRAAISDIRDETQEKLNEVNGFWNKLKKGAMDALIPGSGSLAFVKEQAIILKDGADKERAEALKNQDETNKIKTDAEIEYLKKLRELRVENIGNSYKREIEKTKEAFKEEEEKYADHADVVAELEKKKNKTIEDLRFDHNATLKQMEIDLIRDEDKRKIAQLELNTEVEKHKYKDQKDVIKAIEKKSNDDLFDLAIEYAEKKGDETAKIEIGDQKKRLNEQKENEEIFSVELKKDILKQRLRSQITQKEFDKKDLDNQIAVLEIKKNNLMKGSLEYRQIEEKELELQQQISDKKAKDRADEVKDELKTAEDLLKIIEARYKREEEIKLNAIDADLDATKSAIDQQAELASRGLQNTLAYELQKQADLERARAKELQDEKKHAQAVEAEQLGIAFIQAYEGYIEKKVPAGQALEKAAADIFAAKIFSKVVAGSFAEGVENFKGSGSGTSDSNLIAFSNHESVVTAKGTKETPGLVTALNESGLAGAMDWFSQNIYKADFNSGVVLSDVSTKSQTDNALTAVLINEIKDMKQVIKNKPENHTSLDGLGNTINTMVKNGNKYTFIKKRHLE